MNYYPLFRVRSWNNGVRCMSFCILMTKYACCVHIKQFGDRKYTIDLEKLNNTAQVSTTIRWEMST